jgi:hypothetical protein
VVLLCDKGVHVSDTAIDGYCRIQRLFYACVQQFPSLRQEITNVIQAFMTSEESRLKKSTPSLGNFVTLLSVVEVRVIMVVFIGRVYLSLFTLHCQWYE